MQRNQVALVPNLYSTQRGEISAETIVLERDPILVVMPCLTTVTLCILAAISLNNTMNESTSSETTEAEESGG